MGAKNSLERKGPALKRLDVLYETLNESGDPSEIKFCNMQCPYFKRPGMRQTFKVGMNEGHCGITGGKVYAESTICNQERKG